MSEPRPARVCAPQSAHQQAVLGGKSSAATTGVFVGIQQMEYGGHVAAHMPTLGAFSGALAHGVGGQGACACTSL